MRETVLKRKLLFVYQLCIHAVSVRAVQLSFSFSFIPFLIFVSLIFIHSLLNYFKSAITIHTSNQ